MKKLFLFVFCFFLLDLTGCQKQVSQNKEKINIFVSILPQKYFVERIGGDLVDVQVMVKPGASPATYEPTIKQIMALSETDVFFRIGVPFENFWIKKIQDTNPEMRMVDTRENIVLRTMEGDSDEKDVSKKDPHIWLAPSLVKVQSETIAQALMEIKPAQKPFFEKNLQAFQDNLSQVETEIQKSFENLKTEELMVFHPAWGYFADNFGLKQYPIEIEGKEPSIKELAEIIDYAKEKNVKVIFVQKQFSDEKAKAVAKQIGAVVIQIDPLSENYLENLKHIGETISQYLAE